MKRIKDMSKYISLILVLLMMVSSIAYATESVAYSMRYEGERAVMYFIDDQPGFYHVGGTVSWRNNNPGNLRRSDAQIGHDGNFAIFASYSSGYSAMKNLIFSSSLYSGCTIETMIAKYAPSSENNTEAYITYLVNKTGMSRTTTLSSMSSSQRDSLLSAMIKHEGFSRGRYVKTNIMHL